eukprot:CAMPEP_0114487052 /NCGR_PEP_ID=MMETSP0109-20121206/554_1 /TAXON_ID=29199 /ORGANISM="Chlorarachnion reptans, Strain CCCM449" /LENGTH=266 /DNA_ID=CAMNT_0001663279 /DNA_START=39 /DNA_END=836 /DNA_ORIENTATION=-
MALALALAGGSARGSGRESSRLLGREDECKNGNRNPRVGDSVGSRGATSVKGRTGRFMAQRLKYPELKDMEQWHPQMLKELSKDTLQVLKRSREKLLDRHLQQHGECPAPVCGSGSDKDEVVALEERIERFETEPGWYDCGNWQHQPKISSTTTPSDGEDDFKPVAVKFRRRKCEDPQTLMEEEEAETDTEERKAKERGVRQLDRKYYVLRSLAGKGNVLQRRVLDCLEDRFRLWWEDTTVVPFDSKERMLYRKWRDTRRHLDMVQ